MKKNSFKSGYNPLSSRIPNHSPTPKGPRPPAPLAPPPLLRPCYPMLNHFVVRTEAHKDSQGMHRNEWCLKIEVYNRGELKTIEGHYPDDIETSMLEIALKMNVAKLLRCMRKNSKCITCGQNIPENVQ